MKIDFSVVSERLADCFGEREALVNIERNRRYSFREYHLLTNRIVNMMVGKLNLRRGDNAVVILDNDNASLVHWFTAMKGEATLCYANYRDSIDDHTYQIDTVDAKVVFIEAQLLATHYELLQQRQATIVALDKPDTDYPGVLDFWELLKGVDDSNPGIANDDRNDIAIMRFTGGTTGRGKCAMYCADNLLMCKDTCYAIPTPIWGPETRFLHLAPVTHGSGMMFIPTLFKGGCTVTMNEPDLEVWCDNIVSENINTTFVVPTLLYRLLDMSEQGRQRLQGLENVIYGAAPMSPDKLAGLQAAFGNIFVQVYGSTEHFGIALCMTKDDHLVFDGEASHLSSAGRPLPGVELLIVDDEGSPAKPGEIGEIWLRSRAVVRGYYDNPEQTATEFHDGFWKSGDVGRIDARGFFHIVDRKKDMIISGGFNVYANEVEAALNSHSAILMSAVVGIPHSEWGEAVHAEVMLKQGETADATALMEHVRGRLAGYKTPKSIEVVEQLPVSAVGKVLRRKVREKYWDESNRQVG